MYFDVSAQEERGEYYGKTAPPISAPSFKKLWGELLKLLKGTSRATVEAEG